MDRERFEWVTGPVVVSPPTRQEFHAGRGKLETKERARMLVGQIRDKALSIVVNWAMHAPANMLNARMLVEDYAALLPRASDWMPKDLTPAGAMPKGWTAPAAGSPIETGMMI